MAKYVQTKKKLIDVGEVGNANTGDIIYDGGVKLNDGLNALYNTFGDVRLFDTNSGINQQTLHAAGYYQKLPVNYYSAGAVEAGSMHDVDTTTQTFVLTLPKPVRGEQVEIINSNGSFSINKLIVRAPAGSDIKGEQTLELSLPKSHVVITCVDESTNAAKWDYKIVPMFGDFSVPVNKTVDVTNATPVSIELFNIGLYQGAKLLMSGDETSGEAVKERTLSEALIMVDPNNTAVYSDEYSILFKTQKLYTVDFSIRNSAVVATVTSNKANMKFSIKTIETIKAEIL